MQDEGAFLESVRIERFFQQFAFPFVLVITEDGAGHLGHRVDLGLLDADCALPLQELLDLVNTDTKKYKSTSAIVVHVSPREVPIPQTGESQL